MTTRTTVNRGGPGAAFVVTAVAGLALALVAGLLLAGCTPKDPKERLRLSRQGYEVEPLTWVEGPAEERAPGETAKGAEGAGAPGSGAGEERAAPKRIAILSLRVVRKTAPLSLPCLTIDVTFEGTNGEHAGPVTVVLPLEGLEDAGGALELTRRIELPDFPVDHLGVVLHPAKDDAELMSLCEAQAIGGGPSSP